MTLTIHTEQDDKRQLLMTIEVPEERIEKQMRETARKLARDVNVPGFRRGKAPYQVIVSRVGREALRGEAVEDLIQPVFAEALEQINPDIYAPAQFHDLEMEPLVLKFTIPLTPEVDLGDYRSLRKEIEPVTITEEALAEALERLRVRHQVLEEVERPAAAGDQVAVSGRGELILVEAEPDDSEDADAEDTPEEAVDDAIDGEEAYDEEEEDQDVLFDTDRMNLVLDSEKLFPGTPFVENIVGMSVGESKDFTFTFPDDFEDEELAGKEAMFSIELLQVQSREVPPLDEELAQKEGYETLAELQAETQKNLQVAAEAEAQNELIDGMIHDMLEIATMVYPPTAVEMEIDNRVRSFKNQVTRAGWEWEDYLKLQVTGEETLREEFREAAEDAVRHQLVLRQFVLTEKLQIKDEDIEAKIAERTSAFSDNETLAKSMRDYYAKGAGLDMISSEILMDKVGQRVKAILEGTAPALDELEADEETAAAAAEEMTASEEDAPAEEPEMEATVTEDNQTEALVEEETAVDTTSGE